MRRRRILSGLILISIWGLTLRLFSQEGDSPTDYFPINLGDERQYYEPLNGESDTLFLPKGAISDSIILGDETYYVFQHSFFFADFMDTAYLRKDSSGNVYQYFESFGETIWLRFDVAEGDTYRTKPIFWEWKDYFIISVISRNDTVTTKAGTFTNCIQLRYDLPSAIDEEFWYWLAPGVGIVKHESAWTLPYLLYYANIDGTVYPLGPLVTSKDWLTVQLEYRLAANYPNPFNPTTTIEFSITRNGIVTLTVFDVLGRQVATILNEYRDTGHHKIQWNARHVPSGIYFIKMKSGDFSQVKKCILVR